jgi:Tol biopolymer transport system component
MFTLLSTTTGCRRRIARASLLPSSTSSKADRDIVVKGWAGFNAVNWAPDGKSLFVSSQSPTTSTLLHVDLEGHATPLWDARGWRTYGVPAPNGRELAIAGISSDSNVWMIENF